MPLYLSPVCNGQTFDANGNPLSGGQIETYLAGSSTPAATYTDDTGGTPQSNPIILNTLGFPTLGSIWLNGGQSYKFVIKDAGGVTLRTIDNISGVNDASVSQSEWVTSGFTPTYINATSFSVPGDQTGILQVNRRLRTTNTSGFVYSTVSNSVFAAGITTLTVSNDSATLDPGLTVVEYGLLSAANPAMPAIYAKNGSVSSSGLTQITARMLGRTTAGTGAIQELTSTQITASFIDAATDTAAGKVELATNAEAQTGADTVRAVTPANLNATVIGMGQSWQDVTATRAAGTNYTNSTGRPIMALVAATAAAGTGCDFTLGGSIVSRFNQASATLNGTHSVIIPNGAVYRVNNGTIFSWWELR